MNFGVKYKIFLRDNFHIKKRSYTDFNDFLVDGGMSQWSDFTDCSEKCGVGSQERQRTCTNPPPSFGGKQCGGEFLQVQECKIKDCPG